jgi:thiamine biosynthesis lipoprotein
MRRAPSLAVLLLAVVATPGTAATLRMTATTFGLPLTVETVSSAAAEVAMRDAVTATREMETLVDPVQGALADLNAAAGTGPKVVPAPLFALLRRALDFCVWSEGSYGPLAGRLHELWGLRDPVAAVPRADALQLATAATGCGGLQLDAAAGTAALAARARLDLWGFARGAAVDAAIERLASHGVADASVTLGPVQRAVGPGPGGTGWPVTVAVPDELYGLTRRLDLRDRAFAIAGAGSDAFRAGGVDFPPWLDHRQGQPGEGVVAAAAVTERAVDAEGLAATGFVTGNRRGAALMAQLRPTPSAIWLLGQGTGTPLVTDYRWGSLPRRPVPQ